MNYFIIGIAVVVIASTVLYFLGKNKKEPVEAIDYVPEKKHIGTRKKTKLI